MPFLFDPLPHDEAVKRIAGLPLMPRAMFDELLPELKAYAFTITGLDGFDQLARARDLIQAVPAGEKTWDKAKKEIASELDGALTGKEAQTRAELLLRTHTFRAYAAARYRLLMSQRDVFPFWQYKTHGDNRVRPSHVELSGKIFPAGHPIWQRIFPPWDWGCRCLVVPRMKDEVGRMKDEEKDMAPENRAVFDGDMADAIHAGERLPNGVSLLPSPTWAASPWSEPGTVQHTWKLIQERYADNPETLKAFTKWAKATKIPNQRKTVWTWVNGPRKRTPKPVVPAWPDSPKDVQIVRRLGGSTGAQLVKDRAGRQYVMKRGANAEHLREEFASDEAYRALGVLVPEARLYETADGPVKLARWVEGRTLADFLATASEAEAAPVLKQIREGFLADAWLGNWDVAGMNLDNILVDAAGLPWRIDNGGALRFRAMGKKKTAAEWSAAVPELETLLDPKRNPSAAKIFKGITEADMREQLVELSARSEAAIAAAPEGAREVLRLRLLTLQDKLTVREFSAAFAQEVKAARLVGKSHLGDKDLVEDTTVLFWEEADENGMPLTRAKLKLTEKGSDALVDALREDLLKLKPLASAAPGKRVMPGDTFWQPLEIAVKHINHHASDGIYNPAKTNVLDDIAAKLAAYPANTADEKAMIAHYQDVIAQSKAAMASKGKTPFFAQYEPPPPPATAARRRREDLDITASKMKWVAKTKDRGFARQEKAELLDQASYQIESQGAKMNVIPWTEANGARSSVPYAFRGYVEMTIPGEVSPRTLERAAKLMSDAGVDIAASPPEFSELLYLRKGLSLADLTPAKKKAWRAIADDTTLDEAAKVAKLKAWTEKNLKLQLDAANGYQPRGQANSFGQGWQKWERFDLTRAQIESEMSGYTLTHQSGTPLPDLIDSILSGGGQFTPTTERLRAGVPITAGMSSHTDMGTGGANYLFTRICEKSRPRGQMQFKIGNLARMDAYSFDRDRFGDVRPAGESTHGDTEKARCTSITEFKSNAAKAGNETLFKWGLSLLDEIEKITTNGAKEREAVLKVFKKHKYTTLPDGRKIEDIIQ